MPSFISVVKRITKKPSKKSSLPGTYEDAQFKTDVRLDYWITSARLLKAAGENLPFPWLKGASDLVLQVLQPLRLARTNQQDFNSLAQDILDTLRPIQEQAARLSLEGSSETQILQDILSDFETVKSDLLGNCSSVWTTPTMQRLIQSYQSRLQKEVQVFNMSNLVDMHTSVHKTETATHLISAKLDTVLAPSSTKQQQPELENYRSLKAGDLRVVETRSHEHVTESHILYKGKKTWKIFHDNDAERRWLEEVQFYHTSRLQPHVRQLFGFTQSQDFLGLVFHEHSITLDTVWNKMRPIERFLSQAQFFDDWNKALSFLSSTSFRRFVVTNLGHEPYSAFFPYENDDSALYALADSLGALQVAFSSHEDQHPVFAFVYPIANCLPKPPSIRDLQDTFTSHNSQITHADVAQLQRVLYGLLPSYASGCKAEVQAIASLRINAFADTNFSSITHITLPIQSMAVSWHGWTGNPGIPHDLPQSKTNWQRATVPVFGGTSHVTFTGVPEIPMGASHIFQYIPSFWNRAKESSLFRDKTISLIFDHPGEFHLQFLVDVLVETPRPNMLYLFLRQEFQFQCNGLLDTSDMFYFSFDPIGTSRLTEFDLQRFGFVTAHSFYHSVESKDVPDDIMDAILELGDYPSLHEDQTLEEFICSSLPITRRSSSVDRITRTPNPYRIHNSLHHPRSHYTKHEPLCELAGGKECVCPEAKRQRISAGFFGGFTNDIEYNGRECPCFSREPKRQRTKSVDRADRMMIRILRWMTLARDIGMADSGELLKWYLFPTVFDSYAIDYRQISFGLRQVSPWTVLVDPPEPERVGRPTQRRPP